MKKALLVLWMTVCTLMVWANDKKDHGAAVAGHYKGKTYIELFQKELDLNVELKRSHRDSVIVVIKDFKLPTGQTFSYTSKGMSVKPEVKDGKTIYKLHINFIYVYNKMPFNITAKATIIDDDLDSEAKADVMQAMETKLTYKARKVKK